MFVAVWLLYAADRLLDASDGERAGLEARHFFHARHRTALLAGIVIAAAVLLPLILGIPEALFRFYAGAGLLLLAWFGVIHVLARSRSERLPKELAVGVFFSVAVFAPSWLAERAQFWRLAPAAICFGLLCGLNCLCIFAWEHEDAAQATAHVTTRVGVRLLRPLGAAILAASISGALLSPTELRPIWLALGLAAGLLLGLNAMRRSFDRTNLRAAADLVLLTPLLLIAFVR